MRREESLLSYMNKEESELSDDELLDKLSDEYTDALRKKDHLRIDEEIAPRFWERFASYFNEYAVEYKMVGDNPDDTFAMAEVGLGQLQTAWMDQVLQGEIAIAEEADQEPAD